MNNSQKVHADKIEIGEIAQHKYKSGVKQMEVRQTFVRNYGGVQSQFKSLSDVTEYDSSVSYEETRVMWLTFPDSWSDQEAMSTIQSHIKKGAAIVKIMSHDIYDVLEENQVYAIENEIATLDSFAKTHCVKNKEGQIVLHNGLPVYKSNRYYRQMVDELTGEVLYPANYQFDYRENSKNRATITDSISRMMNSTLQNKAVVKTPMMQPTDLG